MSCAINTAAFSPIAMAVLYVLAPTFPGKILQSDQMVSASGNRRLDGIQHLQPSDPGHHKRSIAHLQPLLSREASWRKYRTVKLKSEHNESCYQWGLTECHVVATERNIIGQRVAPSLFFGTLAFQTREIIDALVILCCIHNVRLVSAVGFIDGVNNRCGT